MARVSNKQNKQNLTEQAEREGDGYTCEEGESETETESETCQCQTSFSTRSRGISGDKVRIAINGRDVC